MISHVRDRLDDCHDTTASVRIDRRRPELTERANTITERELAIYSERTAGSQAATERARKVLPAGVPSSFQAYDPHPIVVKHASGSRMIDVDDNEYVDYDMGFGALFAGHMHPAVRRAVEAQLDDGTLYVTPCELDAEVAELLAERYGLPMWRPTNSGTEATMDAIRLARGVTKREKLVKVEGGYHGHHDEVMISNKPPLDKAGPADAPNSMPQSGGITQGTIDDVIVIPYNDADALERVLQTGDVAAFIVEPVMENIGICLPQPGYLEAVREITATPRHAADLRRGEDRHHGRLRRSDPHFGVQPDLVALAKSIGGGFPVGAFGGKAEYMDLITTGEVLHLGTYNGNPLVMAAAKATLTEACTPRGHRPRRSPATSGSSQAVPGRDRPHRHPGAHRAVRRQGLHHVVRRRPSATTATTRPRTSSWRSRSGSTASTAACCSRPGLDEQWLISVMHDEADAMRYAAVFAEFVDELVA